MDYRRLSRESLIHEIEQLHQELDKYKLLHKRENTGIEAVLSQFEVPVYVVDAYYNIVWANAYCLQHYSKLSQKKCYNVFFDRQEVCTDCVLQKNKEHRSIQRRTLTKEDRVIELVQLPFDTPEISEGVLEYHMVVTSQEVSQDDYRKAYVRLLGDIETLNEKGRSQRHMIEQLSKAMENASRAINGYFAMAPEDRLTYKDVVKKSSEELHILHSKLMMFSKNDETELVSDVKAFNLIKLIEEVTKQSHLIMSSYNNKLKLVCSPTIPEIIRGNAFEMKLTLMYLHEWFFYVSQDGQVSLTVSEITQDHKKLYLRCSYKCENADLSLLEEERLESFSAQMALDYAMGYLKKMKAVVETNESVNGAMTMSFVIEFEKLAVHTKEEDLAHFAKKSKVLIVDDEKPDIPMDVFERFDIHFARTGKEATALYFDLLPDITLVNVTVEDCDGFEVLDTIEKRRRDNKPIIAMSYKLIAYESEFMKDYGFDDYISKPLTHQAFEQIVEKYL